MSVYHSVSISTDDEHCTYLDLQVAEGARLQGAGRIIGVDLNPDKFEIGKAYSELLMNLSVCAFFFKSLSSPSVDSSHLIRLGAMASLPPYDMDSRIHRRTSTCFRFKASCQIAEQACTHANRVSC